VVVLTLKVVLNCRLHDYPSLFFIYSRLSPFSHDFIEARSVHFTSKSSVRDLSILPREPPYDLVLPQYRPDLSTPDPSSCLI
jgi:hypothetical protein